MGMAQAFADAVCSCSLGFRFFSGESEKSVSSSMRQAGLEAVDASAYLSGSLLISLPLSALASFALFSAGMSSFPESSAAFLLLFGALLLCFLKFPTAAAWRRALAAEAELPLLLREFAVYLEVGLPFEKCLQKISSSGYSLSHSFSLAHKQVKTGSSVQEALLSISAKSPSVAVKRSVLLLASIYETGTGADSLKRTSEELSAAQLSSQRTQGGRFSFIAIVFIATSALLPSFFSIYAAVSPFVSGGHIQEWQVWLAFLLLFPALNLAALASLLSFLPPAARNTANEKQLLSNFLARKRFPYSRFIASAAALSLLLAALLFLAGSPSAALLSLCLLPILYFGALYAAQREISEAESFLPDALYSASAVHKILSPEKMLSSLAQGGFGRLSEAFAAALRRHKSGEPFQHSLERALEECPSPLAGRAFRLLSVAYETGADMRFALRESAQDVSLFFSLLRERSASLSLQRYTIFASSALLVPLILGTLVSSVPSIANAGSSVSSANAAQLPTLSSAAQAYLFICAALSSLAISILESHPKKAILYFAAIAPLSQILFAFSSAGALSLGLL